jgi:hypothetical protein
LTKNIETNCKVRLAEDLRKPKKRSSGWKRAMFKNVGRKGYRDGAE